jgi:glycosyltransferase involved in cell wall biosynthesis
MNMENPLVSIIVRTKDRPQLLANSIRGIAAQTYRPIEVVLVNDGGCDLDIDETRSVLGDISLNYFQIEKNSGRAHAGNVGIENAQGEFTGFLDDDDELYPDHVETLVPLLHEGGCRVAYSAVKFVEREFDNAMVCIMQSEKHVFAKEFSYGELILANYIPLIAVLFETRFLKSLKFNEQFDLYEDWDMLIRAGEATNFCFINKVTAIYAQWGTTQVAFSSSPEIIQRETLRLYKKHQMKIPVQLIYHLREENARKDTVIAEKSDSLARAEIRTLELEKAVQTKENAVVSLEQKLHEKDEYIRTIHAGRGWRLLTKYYKMRDKVLQLSHWLKKT